MSSLDTDPAQGAASAFETPDVHASRRRWLHAVAAATTVAACPALAKPLVRPLGGPSVSVPAAHPHLIARTHLPGGQMVQGMRVGGLSALDQDASGQWWFACDDHHADPPARVYQGAIALDWATSTPTITVSIDKAVVLHTPEGHRYPEQACDAEALRCLPNGQLLIASEGHRQRGLAPWIRVFDTQGRFVRDFSLPTGFARQRHRGPRPNQVFEGLAISPDGRIADVALEGPLIEDGPPPNTRAGAPVRILRFDVQRGIQVAEFVYELAPLPHDPWALGGTLARTGVSEILYRSANKLLVLERALTPGARFRVQLFEADLSEASDVLGQGPLVAGRYRSARKRLVFDFNTEGVSVDNLEGMAWGPTLSDGTRVLLLCADDNFLPFLESQFIALSLPTT